MDSVWHLAVKEMKGFFFNSSGRLRRSCDKFSFGFDFWVFLK
jgi:hypothetical protein